MTADAADSAALSPVAPATDAGPARPAADHPYNRLCAWLSKVCLVLAVFGLGGILVHSGWLWTRLKWGELDPMLGMPVGIDYLSLVIAGVLVVMFSIEHILALLRGEDIVPAWH